MKSRTLCFVNSAVLLALLLSSSIVWATPPKPSGGGLMLQGQQALGGAGGNGTGVGGGADISVRDTLQIPFTPSAIAPTVLQYNDCPVVTQGAEATSWPIFSKSVADKSKSYVNGVCVCYHNPDKAAASQCMHRYACRVDNDYYETNTDTCPAK